MPRAFVIARPVFLKLPTACEFHGLPNRIDYNLRARKMNEVTTPANQKTIVRADSSSLLFRSERVAVVPPGITKGKYL